MQTIWKFPLELKYEQTIEIPSASGLSPSSAKENILCVQNQGPNEIPCLWAIVDPRHLMRKFKVYIVGTGHQIITPDINERTYIGTVQQRNGALVFHVFGQFAQGE